MREFAATAWRLLKGLPLAVLGTLLQVVAAVALAVCDVFCILWKRLGTSPERTPTTRRQGPGGEQKAASIVIPNWNGKELLEKYLPSVIAAVEPHPGSEVIVVDNGSEDGSTAFLAERFPQIRVVALERNLGF